MIKSTLWSPERGTDQTIDVQYLRKVLGTQVFGAVFTKVDGTVRTGSFRLAVQKNLTGQGSSYDRDARGNLTVWDMTKRAYRTIRLASLLRLRFKGREIVFTEVSS